MFHLLFTFVRVRHFHTQVLSSQLQFVMDAHWADIDRAHDAGSGIAAIERQQMTKPRPLEIESPLLHRPSASYVHAADELCSHELSCGTTSTNLSICRGIVRQCIATSFARVGFQSCTAECLETFTDVLYHYLQNVFQLLRVSMDSHGVEASMPSAICQVFAELGLSSAVALEDYY